MNIKNTLIFLAIVVVIYMVARKLKSKQANTKPVRATPLQVQSDITKARTGRNLVNVD